MHSDNFDNLIVKFLENSISDQEAELLTVWLNIEENKDYFNEFVEIHYVTNKQVRFDHESSLGELKKTIRNRSKVKNLRIFKYAVAASLVIAISIPLFLKDKKVQKEVPIIVQHKIGPGSDVATLTLGDGTEVILEKGQLYKTDQVTSTGTSLIYNSPKLEASESLYNYLTIPRGGQYKITLSDSTIVWMNSDSKLKYPVNFQKGTPREVELVYGEAYFEVAPSSKHEGSKFTVLNESQQVEVLGTRFNIKAYKDDQSISTTLVEGQVKIKYNDVPKEVLLVPNQQFTLNKVDGGTNLLSVNTSDFVSWKKGVFSFKNMTFEEIMKTLSRWYDVRIVFANEALKKITFRGVLSKKQRLEDLLNIFKSSNDFDFEIQEKTVIIK